MYLDEWDYEGKKYYALKCMALDVAASMWYETLTVNKSEKLPEEESNLDVEGEF